MNEVREPVGGQKSFIFAENHEITTVSGFAPFYTTDFGVAYLADSLEVMRAIPDQTVNLVLTSPPYALHFQKEYGNVAKSDYVEWFLDFADDMKRLNKRGLQKTKRPSGHNINPSFSKVKAGGSIPPNVIEEEVPPSLLKFGNNVSNDTYAKACKAVGLKRHPARFPAALAEFFIKMLTDDGDLVLDPFAGSNTTGAVAEQLQRWWIAVDNVKAYLEGSKFRFFGLP